MDIRDSNRSTAVTQTVALDRGSGSWLWIVALGIETFLPSPRREPSPQALKRTRMKSGYFHDPSRNPGKKQDSFICLNTIRIQSTKAMA